MTAKVTMKVQEEFNECLSRQSFESFVTKLGMVIHHHESEHYAERLFLLFQGQGHSKGSYN